MILIGAQTYTVYERGAPSFSSAGVVTRASETSTSILAAVQPVDRRDLERTSLDGLTAENTIKFFTETDIDMPSPGSSDKSEIEYLSDRYEIVEKEDWGHGLIPHYRYLATRDDV